MFVSPDRRESRLPSGGDKGKSAGGSIAAGIGGLHRGEDDHGGVEAAVLWVGPKKGDGRLGDLVVGDSPGHAEDLGTFGGDEGAGI
jgi:hypothetical protein